MASSSAAKEGNRRIVMAHPPASKPAAALSARALRPTLVRKSSTGRLAGSSNAFLSLLFMQSLCR
jgi:hypothetical protein